MDAESLLQEVEQSARKRGKIDYWKMSAPGEAVELFDALCSGWMQRRESGKKIGVRSLCAAIQKGCDFEVTQNTVRDYLRRAYAFEG